MSIPIPLFWNLLTESRLLAPEQCQQLAADFGQVKGASEQGNARTLSEWLVSRNVLSRYQAAILLAGRSGPFYYGDYKVYDRVDKGRIAGAFRAVHGPTGHPVLLQFLTGPVVTDPELWAEAANQVLGLATVSSPHLQRIYEPVDLGSFKFVVGEDLRGAGLDERMQMGRFQPQEACRLVRMAAIGLAQLHQVGRAHGDIRPTNLFLDTSTPSHPGNIKVLFEPQFPPGPINFADQDPNGRLAQTADFLAPELMQAGRTPDPLSDVYSLGCTLYTLLAGAPPFAGGNVLQKMKRHAAEAIRPLEAFGVPQPLSQLVSYLMAKNPAVRYQSAAIVAEQLGPFVDPQLLYFQPSPPLPTQPTFEYWIHQRQAQLASQAAAAVAVPAGIPVGSVAAAGGVQAVRSSEAAVSAAPALPKFGVNLPAGAEIGPSNSLVKTGAVKTSLAIPPEEFARRRQKDEQKKLALGLVAVGAVLVALIVLVNAMNKVPADAQTAKNNNGTDTAVDNGPPAPILRTVEGSLDGSGSPTPKTTNVSNSPGTGVTPPSAGPAVGPGAGQQTPAAGAGEPAKPVQEILPDDGKLLWASPTQGAPAAFELVPPEGQLYIVLRPADLLAKEEGQRVLQALGPNFAAARASLEKGAGYPLEQIERLIVTLHNNDAKFPRVSAVVTPKAEATREALLEKWGSPAAGGEATKPVYSGGGWSYFISTTGRSFVMGDPKDVAEVARANGAAPVIFRDIERLRKTLDGERHINVLFNPDFFDTADGEPLFAAERAKLRSPLDWFLGEDLRAGLLSMHLDPSATYLELRMLGSLSKDSFSLANDLRERMKTLPDGLFDFLSSVTPPQYWRKLSLKYTPMIESLYKNSRVGAEGDQAIVNAYLPSNAAHNLVLGGELLLASTPGASTAIASNGPAAASGPKTVEEVLNLKTSLSFDALSLEFAMDQLAAEAQDVAKGSPFGKGGPQQIEIRILGDDLKLDGITRNQTIRDFKQDGKTIAEILTAMVMKANPVTTVKSPDELDQKLIWVVAPSPDDPNKKMVLITVRQVVEKNKYTLPAVFVPKK